MRKLNKRYSFFIGTHEETALDEIRNYGINVSRYLRFSLRRLAKVLYETETKMNRDHCHLDIKNENDLKRYSFLLED